MREPGHLSDWIQYLIAQKNHAYSLLGGLIALDLGVITLEIWYIDKSNYLGIILSFILSIFIAGGIIYLLKSSKSKLNRPKLLLERIMHNPSEIEVDEMRREWYRRNVNMWSRLEKILVICLPIGFCIFIATGFMIIILTTFTDIFKDKSNSLSLGVTILSLGFATFSIWLAFKSDDKMALILNESFLQIVDVYEDARIQLLQHPDWLGYEGTFWKCRTYLDRAIRLTRTAKIDTESQNKLFNQFDDLINRTGVDWRTIPVNNYAHIHYMEEHIAQLDLTDVSREKLGRIVEYIRGFENQRA